MSNDMERSGSVGDDPVNLVSELLRAVPRFVDRTRNQAELASSLVGHLPCLGALLGSAFDDDPGQLPHGMKETVGIDVLSLLEEDQAASPPDGAASELAAGDQAAEPATDSATGTGEPAPASDRDGPPPDPTPSESDLPVQGYDSLAASQVVPRLATMSEVELRTIRSYELAHRNRQTILNRINQRLSD